MARGSLVRVALLLAFEMFSCKVVLCAAGVDERLSEAVESGHVRSVPVNSKQYREFFKGSEAYTQQPEETVRHSAHKN